MSRDEVSVRDRGVALVSRVNRWLIVGAIGLSGVLSLAAANAFRGHPRSAQSQASSAATGGAQAQSSGGGSSLGQPAQPPASSLGGGGAAVSGGS
jgi:hypothetical protein